jgi:malate/lactate dehydrogenase
MNVEIIGQGMMGSPIALGLVMKAIKLLYLIEIGQKQ